MRAPIAVVRRRFLRLYALSVLKLVPPFAWLALVYHSALAIALEAVPLAAVDFHALLAAGLSLFPIVLALPLSGSRLARLVGRSDPDCLARSVARAKTSREANLIAFAAKNARPGSAIPRGISRRRRDTLPLAILALIIPFSLQFAAFMLGSRQGLTALLKPQSISSSETASAQVTPSADFPSLEPKGEKSGESAKPESAADGIGDAEGMQGSGKSDVVAGAKEAERETGNSPGNPPGRPEKGRNKNPFSSPIEGNDANEGDSSEAEAQTDGEELPADAHKEGTGRAGSDHAGRSLVPSPLEEYKTYRDGLEAKGKGGEARASSSESDYIADFLSETAIEDFSGGLGPSGFYTERERALEAAWTRFLLGEKR